MINCEKCGKENQDHYKFCLGCGAELPRADAAPKPFHPQTPPHGVPAAGGQPAPAPQAAAPPPAAAQPVPVQTEAPPPNPAPVAGAPAPQQAPVPQAMPAGAPPPEPGPPATAPAAGGGATVDCPQCGQSNPQGNRFCAACGYNLAGLVGQAAPVVSEAVAASAPGAAVRLTALRADGTEAGHYDLPAVPSIAVGRDTGSIFAGDSYLSPKHATLTRRGNEVLVKDEGSLNGVYIKLTPNQPWKLCYGDVFRIGQEIIRFEELKGQPAGADGVERFGSPSKGYIGRICLVIGRDTTGNAFPVPAQGIHCGRERGDVLFSEDGYVSGLHCSVAKGDDGDIYLTDVGSSNGTFARLNREHALVSGDVLLMGQQLFRIDF